jgi:ubiquitin-small subunit ribosomal protein S27Ae
MQVFVRNATGSPLALDVAPSTSVFSLKEEICEINGLDLEFVSLIHSGVALDESETLESCGIPNYANIDFEMKMLGGKKKKKAYTTPKRVAHKHKAMKMATMNFYKIEGENVKPLKRVCPDESCGDGVFMAKHFDRHYCGRCRLVFKIEDAPKKDPKGNKGALKRSVIEAQLRQKKEAAAAAKKEKK